MERKALGSVQKGWGAFSLSHHHHWDKEDESCSVCVLAQWYTLPLRVDDKKGMDFRALSMHLSNAQLRHFWKRSLCVREDLFRESLLGIIDWTCFLKNGLTSSFKKTKGASPSHRCPQTEHRLQWNKRPVVSIWGDLSNSTRSWKGVHLQYEERRHGFLLSRGRSADEGWLMPAPPQIPPTQSSSPC